MPMTFRDFRKHGNKCTQQRTLEMPVVSLFCKQADTLYVPFSICLGSIHIKIAHMQGIFYCVQDAGITACNCTLKSH